MREYELAIRAYSEAVEAFGTFACLKDKRPVAKSLLQEVMLNAMRCQALQPRTDPPFDAWDETVAYWVWRNRNI